jgi:hypothetical protein
MEGNIFDSIVTVLTGYGVLGVWNIYSIWQNQQKDKKIDDLTGKLFEQMHNSFEREKQTTSVLTELTIIVKAMGAR